MAVSAFPEIRLMDAVAPSNKFGLSISQYTRIYSGGRDAVYSACRGLRLDPGVPVWLPSFHCGVEVQAAIDAGAAVGFYRIRPDLAIDEEDLVRRLDSQLGPVLVIHYFGFPQPGIHRIASYCSGRKVSLIEDCTHALFSKHEETPLGNFAPIAVYSFRKTLPIYDGGALQVQRDRIADESSNGFECPELSPAASVWPRMVKDVGHRMAGRMLTDIYRRARYGAGSNPAVRTRVNTGIPEKEFYDAGMSRLSQRIASQADPSRILEARRSNWSCLAAQVKAPLVFPSLMEGTCPLFLPIWVAERAKVIARLAGFGIETYVFGEFPHPTLPLDEYPETGRMRDNILCLPIHQQLTAADLRRVAAALEGALLHL